MFSKKPEVLLLLLIFLSAFLLRWFKLSDNLFFGFEQGRDAFIIENIYRLKDFVLTGPSTSIGGVFHGSYYYYLMAIPYFLSSGNPQVAVLFLAFTIPSLHPDGWNYLHKFYYPNKTNKQSKVVYIVIEKYVYPVWEEKWIRDLGKSTLIFEKKFDKLRLQKRITN